ncbi:RidA family protein [Sedimentitalea sp. JM2-8]|uniref:RidA family protein n=1 Tax=Sedimentitalea xiamensis TaxID=3050037 RepID=A0ABT7FL36_9RHOB|nr:RidA family protein [Sedimentitalea xiamensis]MDK3075822.1 RidA family protein [Sedimentitalea xiamensis]
MAIEAIGGAVVLADGTPVPLSKAIRAGDFVMLSGQLAFGPDGKIVDGGIEAQTRQCLDSIKALLVSVGAGLENVARVTVWLSDPEDFGNFNRVYAEYFSSVPPARSTVCSALMLPDAKVEIEATVFYPKP